MTTGRTFFVNFKVFWNVGSIVIWKENRLRLKCDGTRAETRFRLLAKRTSPFKSTGASVQSTTGNRGVRISGSNAGYTVFRGSVKGTGYPLHSPVSPSFPRRASPCSITFQLDSTIVTYDVFLKASPFSQRKNAVLMALCVVRYNVCIRRGKGFFYD